MLIRFNVKNFLSFDKTEEGKSLEFSMITGKVLRKNDHVYNDDRLKLLKLATVYGANASGKSNFVKALSFVKETIKNGFTVGHVNKYCRVSEENRDLPSYFELEIKIKDKYYSYGFEAILSKSIFISEWLIELSYDSEEKLIFSRDIPKGIFEFGDGIRESGEYDRLKFYSEDIACDDSVLFLKIMNQHKNNLYNKQKNEDLNAFANVYKWIRDDISIRFPNSSISNYDYLKETDNLDKIQELISSFGTGIKRLCMVEIPLDKALESLPEQVRLKLETDIEKTKKILEEQKIKNDKNKNGFDIGIGIGIRADMLFLLFDINKDGITCRTIKFLHEKENIMFDLSEESDGTRRVLDLIEILLTTSGKTYIVDELDRCLHPSLTYHFIELYLQIAKTRDIQLIVTTHESRLLDFELLRRDEVWFIDKDNSGKSKIYSLEEYNTRFDKKIDKAYLDGRYGGVPIFNTLFPM